MFPELRWQDYVRTYLREFSSYSEVGLVAPYCQLVQAGLEQYWHAEWTQEH